MISVNWAVTHENINITGNNVIFKSMEGLRFTALYKKTVPVTL